MLRNFKQVTARAFDDDEPPARLRTVYDSACVQVDIA